MIPGISARPSASTVSLEWPRILPTSTMRPSFTATPPRRGGAPRPSTSIASRITRSNIAAEYTHRKSGTDPISLDLKNKVAVVTGGAKGIGAATAKAFAQAGAKVEVLDIAQGHDVTSEKTVRDALADVAKRLGGIDILVNNAGKAIRKSALELSREDFQSVIDLNLT